MNQSSIFDLVSMTQIWLNAIKLWRAWLNLAIRDVRSRYSRTVIGPWWSTISLLIFAVGIGFIFSVVFSQPIQTFLPFVITGLLAWGLFSSFITEGIGCFTQARSYLLNITIPFPVFVFQVVTRQLIVFGQSLLVAIAVILVFRVEITSSIFWLPVAVLVTALAGVGIVTLVGGVCARHPDVGQFLPALVQVCFLLTPVFWPPEAASSRPFVYELNPFYYFVTLIRAPLLGQPIGSNSLIVALSITAALLLTAAALTPKFARRLSLWVC